MTCLACAPKSDVAADRRDDTVQGRKRSRARSGACDEGAEKLRIARLVALCAAALSNACSAIGLAVSPSGDTGRARVQPVADELAAGHLVTVPRRRPALARPEARVRLQAGRARRSARPGARSLGHASILTTERHDNQRLKAVQAAVERLERGKTFDPKIHASDRVSRNLSRSRRTELRSKRRPRQGIRYQALRACGMESWYRYGDSNPGPVAENHVS
jgi:hypothetical protein